MSIESTIIKNLIYSEEYTRNTIPHLKVEYFKDNRDKIIIGIIIKFFIDYNKLITKEILKIELSSISGQFSDKEELEFIQYIDNLDNETTNVEWLISETEEFCKNSAVYNAIHKSIEIIQGTDKKTNPDSIPLLLSDALAVSFNTDVGHDYIEDAESRYEYYHKKELKIPFNLSIFNKISDGGISKKTLTMILAGCVHPDTPVTYKFKRNGEWIDRTAPIITIDKILTAGCEVLVDSPDGFIPVNYFIHKGEYEEYVLILANGVQVRCNENHLFETTFGWMMASALANMEDINYKTNFKYKEGDVSHLGFVKGTVIKTGATIPIVDINVEHENHRYYTNGVSSHNTGVGKSYFMCDYTANVIKQGRNALYITLEMDEERIAERVDENLMNVTKQELKVMENNTFLSNIDKIKRKGFGKLIIKEYPENTAHVGHFRALLHELKSKKNFVPDFIAIDYIAIALSQRIKLGSGINTNTFYGTIASEFRGLAKEFNIPIMSAQQFNRGGYDSSDAGLTDIAESWGISHSADLLFSLTQTEELKEVEQIMVKQLKNRYEPVDIYTRFVVGADKSRMRLYDIEDSAQRGISGAGKRSNDTPKFESFKF